MTWWPRPAPLFLSSATGYVCGSPGFAAAVRQLLVGLGLPADNIRVEAFGPTAEDDAETPDPDGATARG